MPAFRFDSEADYAAFLAKYHGPSQKPQDGPGGAISTQGGPKAEDKAGVPRIRSCASEEAEHLVVAAWVELHTGRWPELRLLSHYPSGGSRHLLEAVKLKRMLVRPGVPDWLLPIARGGYFSLWIELKAMDGKLSQGQHEWIAALRSAGACVHVCFGASAAIDRLLTYLQMPATIVRN